MRCQREMGWGWDWEGNPGARGLRNIQLGAGSLFHGQGPEAFPEAPGKGGNFFPLDFGTELQPATFQA